MDANAPDETLLELTTRCLDAMEREGESALEDLCRENPRQAAALRDQIDRLRRLGFISSGERMPERLAEFRLLEPLGGGGMGIVYRAYDERLGREVALKVVRPDQLYFADARARFRREVAAVARLQHPGIVPVHSVGEAESVPYFAMDLVEGRSLGQALDALAGRDPATLTGADLWQGVRDDPRLAASSWEEACLRVARPVAAALDHAHRRGILHRDVKPSNIMLARDGRALLLDFGLAVAGPESRLTVSGARLGSLPYLSPEQARGDLESVSPQSDVYGLGVTLYEMLTLRPAFPPGSGTATTLRSIEEGDAPRPRARNPALSREAETVCLTAMDVDVTRRYASAAALANDLDAVLEHRPITARRPGPWRRLSLFARRRPATAVALALGLVLVVGVPSLVAWQEHRAGLALAAERDLAEAHLQTAMEAVDRMLSRVGGSVLADVPQTEALQRRLLEDALEFQLGFLAARGEDPRMRLACARAYEGVAKIRLWLGDHAAAKQAYTDGLALLAAVHRGAAPDELQRRSELLLGLGQVEFSLGEPAASESALRDARAALDALPAELRGSRAAALQEAWIANSLGVTFWSTGRHEDSQRSYREGIALLEPLAAGNAPDDTVHRRLAGLHQNLATTYRFAGRFAAADASARRAVECWRSILDVAEDPGARGELALALSTLGHVRLAGGDLVQGEALLEESRALLERLVADFPATLRHRQRLAGVLDGLGQAARARNDPAEAERRHRTAIEQQRHVLDLTDSGSSERKDLAGFVGNLADACFAQALAGEDGVAETALEASGEAAALFEDVLAERPQDDEVRSELAKMLHFRVQVLSHLRRDGEGLPLLERAIDEQGRALAARPGDEVRRTMLVQHYTWLMDARLNVGPPREAAAVAERLVARLPDHPKGWWLAAYHVAAAASEVADEALAQRARDMLEESARLGFDVDPPNLRTHPHWYALREAPGYEEWIRALEERAGGA